MEHVNVVYVGLVALAVGMFNTIKIVELKNQKRDLVLNIAREGFHLTPCRRKLLLERDYIPLSQGVGFVPFILTVFLACLPIADEKRGLLEWGLCGSCAAFSLFALVTDIRHSFGEVREMRAYIAKRIKPRDLPNFQDHCKDDLLEEEEAPEP